MKINNNKNVIAKRMENIEEEKKCRENSSHSILK